MLPANLYLVDRSLDLAREWKEQFAGCPGVEILAGDYFQRAAHAIVSPANSFGIMDGGLDLAIRNELGVAVEQKIQEVILQKYHGELPVGSAEIIETNDTRWKYMIAAPTMKKRLCRSERELTRQTEPRVKQWVKTVKNC